MAEVILRNIKKSFGAIDVIKGVDLDIATGEFVVFVGPSGCGKSTLLRLIAGLEDITSGEMKIDGEVVNEVPPSKRGIAMVFQSYALYPHMTVFDNIAFGMKLARASKDEIEKRVRSAAGILQLTPYLDRLPKALSGGQRQRVAIGRAIVRNPKVFLFDEPLSNLDAELRVHMRLEIAALHRNLRNSMIYVTHDQVEAMTLADRIVVLNGGRIEQVGSPLELYHNPANLFVARFIGSPAMNTIPATIDGVNGAAPFGSPPITILPGVVDETGAVVLASGARIGVAAPLNPGQAVHVGIRPEHWRIDPHGTFVAEIGYVEHLGAIDHVYARHDGRDVRFHTLPGHGLRSGDPVTLSASAADILLFEESGNAIG